MYFNNFATFRSEKWYSSKFSIEKVKKVIVFDLDETIGSFSDFILLLKYIKKHKKVNISQELFNKLLDLYPEFLRDDIIDILHYLIEKKRSGECYKIYIYTNNIYSPEFPKYIQNYFNFYFFESERKKDKELFETKSRESLFYSVLRSQRNILGECLVETKSKKMDESYSERIIDDVISAFLRDSREQSIWEDQFTSACQSKTLNVRTTNEKTYEDFINCSQLPISSFICFIDNTYYKKMKNKNVYYIYINPYFHKLTKNQIWERLLFFSSERSVDKKENVVYREGKITNCRNLMRQIETFSNFHKKRGRYMDEVNVSSSFCEAKSIKDEELLATKCNMPSQATANWCFPTLRSVKSLNIGNLKNHPKQNVGEFQNTLIEKEPHIKPITNLLKQIIIFFENTK
jgi:hypothetical protein